MLYIATVQIWPYFPTTSLTLEDSNNIPYSQVYKSAPLPLLSRPWYNLSKHIPLCIPIQPLTHMLYSIVIWWPSSRSRSWMSHFRLLRCLTEAELAEFKLASFSWPIICRSHRAPSRPPVERSSYFLIKIPNQEIFVTPQQTSSYHHKPLPLYWNFTLSCFK